jgi:4-amino-4-deoxy-L-arabinose transferase-like glycosyltransferase
MSFLDLRPTPPSAKADAPVRWSTYSRQPLLMGWPVALCLALLLLLPGLIGRDPWRGDDAEQFGIIASLLNGGSWLVPSFQGDTWNQSPLYYWVNALIAWPFSFFLTLPDAARIGNLFWLSATIYALYQTARSVLNAEDAHVLPFLALSAPGLMLSVHETQPDLAIMAGYALFFWGNSRICFERVMPGSTLAALGLGVTMLSGGLCIALPLIVVLLGSFLFKPKLRLNSLVALMLGLLIGFSWFIHAAAFGNPDPSALLEAIWPVSALRSLADIPTHTMNFIKLIAWATWPAWPIAAWTLWRRRLTFWRQETIVPLVVMLIALVVQISLSAARPSKSLVLLVPIILLATASATHLRRGAANMLDAFTLTLFTIAAGFVWLGWGAIHFGWPEPLAQTVTRLEPGFTTPLTIVQPAVAFLLTIGWFVLMRNIPRSPVRGIQHWFAGITLIWALVVALWSPWLDHGMSYTRMGNQIAKQLSGPGCIASFKVSEDARAALSYQLNRPIPRAAIPAGKTCSWLLTETPGNTQEVKRPPNWEMAEKVWSGHRRGTRAERYTLYYRPAPDAVTQP